MIDLTAAQTEAVRALRAEDGVEQVHVSRDEDHDEWVTVAQYGAGRFIGEAIVEPNGEVVR